jgi:hypothetical protein
MNKDVSKSGINPKKIIQQSPITILPMLFAGRFFHKNEAVFAGLKRVFMGLAYIRNTCDTCLGITPRGLRDHWLPRNCHDEN